MHSLKQLMDLANGLLKNTDVGQEYTMNYVASRLSAALDEYPHDSVIRSMAQVIEKQIKNGKFTTSQKELYDVYNHFAGFAANSMIKDAIGDILYPNVSTPKAKIGNETAYTYRPNLPEMNLEIEHNPLESIFEKNMAVATYYDPTLAKLGKNAIADELNYIGVSPVDIKVVSGVSDNSAIVYDAIFTNKLGTAHVPIFVEIANTATERGKIKPPTHFYSNNAFIQLTADNLNKCIVEKAQSEESIEINNIGGIKTFASVISSSFTFEEDAPASIQADKVAMPSILKDLATFEEVVLDASTGFNSELVRTAKALCMREINDMGFKTQIKLSEATDNCIICAAELDSSIGKVEIKLPVEVINDRPQIPAVFYDEANKDKIYDFTKAELSNYVTAAKVDNGQILRYSNDFFNMTYNQLKEEILAGVANKDYVRAEQALSRIEDKFGSEYHRAALTDYSKYLTHISAEQIEAPQHKCRLLLTKGSIEPRCGHYNVPLSRVATDAKGNCELLERKAKYENLAESTGALMHTNKITLT